MAVNIIKKNQGIKGTNIIEHHKNPSGQNNKVKWLLKQSHRNIDEIHNIVSKIIMSGYDMISSWLVAEMIAIDIVKYEFKDKHEYITALIKGKIYKGLEVKPKWHYVTDKLPPNPKENKDGISITPLNYICAYDCGDGDYECDEFMYLGNGEWNGENKNYPIYAWMDCPVNVLKPRKE